MESDSVTHLVKARVCPGEVKVGLILVLEEVLDVTHLMVHSYEVLLSDPGTLLNAEVLRVKIIKSSVFAFAPISLPFHYKSPRLRRDKSILGRHQVSL